MTKLAYTPAGSLDWSGRYFGSVQVIQLVCSLPRKWSCRCLRCHSEFTELQSTLSAHYDSNQPLLCRNADCRLGRIAPTKVTAYEQWLNESEPVPVKSIETEKPKPITIKQTQPTADFRRYYHHALIHKWAEIHDWQAWQSMPEKARDFLLSKVDVRENK